MNPLEILNLINHNNTGYVSVITILTLTLILLLKSPPLYRLLKQLKQIKIFKWLFTKQNFIDIILSFTFYNLITILIIILILQFNSHFDEQLLNTIISLFQFNNNISFALPIYIIIFINVNDINLFQFTKYVIKMTSKKHRKYIFIPTTIYAQNIVTLGETYHISYKILLLFSFVNILFFITLLYFSYQNNSPKQK